MTTGPNGYPLVPGGYLNPVNWLLDLTDELPGDDPYSLV